MRLAGIYFSGTGNTKHCVEKLTSLLDSTAVTLPLESENALSQIQTCDTVILGYSVQFSNLPFHVRNFIVSNASVWKGKRVFCLATMGLFSGDGAGCAARLLKKYGAEIAGGLHIRMPDSISDNKLLKYSEEKNRKIISDADKKIERAAKMIRGGKYSKDGLSVFARLAGLFGQRLWFYGKTAGYSKKLKISDKCIACGKCVTLCPTQNLRAEDGKIITKNRCTQCYRCVNNCPQKAITLLGKKVVSQYRFEDYGS